MAEQNDARRADQGLGPGAYFFDLCLLNQHRLMRGANDEEKRAKLIEALRNCLVGCGHVLLCCAQGPSGVGWETPAPFVRIWCLFEIYKSLEIGVPITMQLGAEEQQEFRAALQQGGLARVNVALDKVNAREAGATMEDDKRDILADIERTVGLDEFNERVRGALKSEYARIATRASFRWAPFSNPGFLAYEFFPEEI